ncbi:hypothetical protein C7999DRAFT_13984 [Corynascus novoguineensis]|uniref:Uncharacterized protein n=1 Tax=Corynascus novoguineensis TaxID=1126955 RepID=A0AAN7CU58_9PEZI|nr:hypothetical protein C7999DRAFT_13984 [Corynascus novoguineensis]
MANASSKKPSCAETASSPPAAAEVPSHVHPLALSTPTPTEADKQPITFQKGAANNAPTGSPLRPTAQSQSTPTVPFHLHSTTEEPTYQGLASSAQPTAKPVASPEAALDQENVPPEPPNSRRHEYQSFTSTRSSPNSDLALKRKVNGESNPESPAASVRVKRAKLETANGPDGSEIDQSSLQTSDVTLERSVSFEEVYGSPGKPAAYKHVIVQYPLTTGEFYILRCDEHGVHFGEHPLRGAAKHLASAQHGFMSKAHATAIRTLGHRVRDCTKELADKNNREVLKAFKDGSYKAFNANNLSQTKRAELGFPPLDPLNAQKVAQHRKQTAGITDPQPCQFYVTSGGDLKCPVLILPWGDISQAGLMGTLADTGIFREFTEDGRPLGVSKLPKCYVYREADGHVVGIRNWAKGYEEGGPLEKKREFPVLCAESADYRTWSVGWVKAADLSPLDFEDPSSREIPFVREAWHYFQTRIRRQQPDVFSARRTEFPSNPEKTYMETPPRQSTYGRSRGDVLNASGEDVVMKDVGHAHNVPDGESDRESIGKGASDGSEQGFEKEDADSPHMSFPNRETYQAGTSAKSASATMPPAQFIAAQALNLQGPGRNGFIAINSGGSADRSASRSARPSPEPSSRAGSVSSSGGHRKVYKIHARSSNRSSTGQTQGSPSMVLPERQADRTMPSGSAASQPQGEVRKPSPASLQNILQDFPGPTVAAPRVESQSPKPAVARRPLPSGPTRSDSPSQTTLLSAVSAKLTQPPSDSRAGSAPAQLSQQTGPVEDEIRLSGPASAAPGLSRHATPQPAAGATTRTPSPAPVPAPAPASAPTSAPEPPQRREQVPPPIQLPPPQTTLPSIVHFNTTPLATPNASAGNTRANSPSLAHHPKSGTPTTTNFSKPETPTLTPTLPQPLGCFVPTMDVFDLAGLMDGETELFRSREPGQYLRLIDDHQSGVLATASDAPVQLRIDPRRIKSVERVSAQAGAVCVVTITYLAAEGGDRVEEKGDEKGEAGQTQTQTQTLVFEKARSTARGLENGTLHARRLCRRLQTWNAAILCPAPGFSLDSVQWRFNSQTPTPTPSTAGPVTEPEEDKPK